MNLIFHKTFGLNLADLKLLLAAISKNPSLDNFQISEATGIGIGKKSGDGKVLPVIQWAQYVGLIYIKTDGKMRAILFADEGNIVFQKDPYLRSPVTSWLFHYNLSKPDPNSAWHYFVHSFLPEHFEFNRDDLINGLKIEFPETKITSINPGVLLNSYLNENAMKPLGILEKIGKDRYRKGIVNITCSAILGYILAKIWDREHPQNMTVGFDALEQPHHLLRTMSIPMDLAIRHLEILRDKGLLDLNRSVKPFQLIKRWSSPLEFLERAYLES
jgi:hypothetical protein